MGMALVFLCFCFQAEASHFRYGTITYEIISESGSGASKQSVVKFTINQGWRRTFFGGPPNLGSVVNTGSFSFGDGSSTSVLLTVTAVNLTEDWFLGTFQVTHTYTGNVDVTTNFSSCCRIGSLQGGNANDSYRNTAIVTLSQTTNENPVSSLPAIVNVPINQASHTFSLNAIDPNGDAISYALSTTTQSSLSPNNPTIFSSINSSTGLVTLNTTYTGVTVGHLWAIQFMMTDSKGATSPIDFIIRIAGTSNPPVAIAPTPANGTVYKVAPGTPVNFTIAASDPDVGDLVTLLGSGIPIGATFNPPSPSNPISASFSWTPGVPDLGAYSVTFSATDGNFAQSLTTVQIIVSLAPIFDVPPTPALGAHNVVEPGQNLTFTAKATDPDPNDQCQITSVMGKNHMGNPIPLYSGVNINPALPTTAGNSTQTTISWTPTLAQWGHKHMFITATDGFNDQTTHEVSILVNTPPSITSTAPTQACVGQKYTYHVKANDQDTAVGDTMWLYGNSLPSWLTFVDSGNGRGSLCGTPTVADLGMHYPDVEVQDVGHHYNGTDVENISINVLNCGQIQVCPPMSLTFTPYNGAHFLPQLDPYTFFFGTTQWKRIRMTHTAGVGPYTYSWGKVGTGQLKGNLTSKSIYLYEPFGPTKVYATVHDAGNGCDYTDTISIGWDDQYFCGTLTPRVYKLVVCENGVTKCVKWKTAKSLIKNGQATLGPCPVPKTNPRYEPRINGIS